MDNKHKIICSCYQITTEELIDDISKSLEILAGQACGSCFHEVEQIKNTWNKNPEKLDNNQNETKQ